LFREVRLSSVYLDEVVEGLTLPSWSEAGERPGSKAEEIRDWHSPTHHMQHQSGLWYLRRTTFGAMLEKLRSLPGI
jgi:hypothetical protein